MADIIHRTGAEEILDYGAGKGRLAQALEEYLTWDVDCYQYDPAREGIDEPPDPCSLVACIDVLEHIEPDRLEVVLDDLQRVTPCVGLFTVHTGPAVKTLSDGRNAHLIQEGIDYWLPRFWKRFMIKTYQDTGNGFWVIVHGKEHLQ